LIGWAGLFAIYNRHRRKAGGRQLIRKGNEHGIQDLEKGSVADPIIDAVD